MHKNKWKYDPCENCGGRNTSKGTGRLRCIECGITKKAPIDQIPDRHYIKGVSTLIGPDGETKQQWIKTSHKTEKREEILKRLLEELPSLIPPRNLEIPPTPEQPRKDLLSVYPIGDAHLGMLSWREETGEDFDLKIAKHRLSVAMEYLVAQGGETDRAVIINLGDFFHSDNNQGVTIRSGNVLDVDNRWAKVLRVGIATMVGMIEIALKRHNTVHVIVEIGNHDDHSAILLSTALEIYYREIDRVTIDTSPSKFHYYSFGKCFLGVTHGDTVKPQDLESIMAADRPVDWGKALYRYWYIGHVHHSRKLEFRGCLVESFRTLAAKDAWHAAHGYRSGMDMVKIVLHESYGEVFRAICDARFVGDIK